MTNKHTSLEKYTSHFIRKGCERVMCERWVGDWTDCNILTPSSFIFSSTSFSFCWAAQSGSWGPIALCWVLVLSTASYLQLTEPVCGTGLYNCLSPTCFLWASHLHLIQPVHSQGYTLISSTGCTSSLIDGWVGGQYVTTIHVYKSNPHSFPPSICSDDILLHIYCQLKKIMQHINTHL